MNNNKISIFKNKEDLYLNFNNNEDNFILVTGISGSGKSTLSNELATKTGGHKISLDLIFGHETEITPQEEKIIKEFKKQHKEWSPELFNTKNKHLYPHYINLFYDFIIDYYKTTNIPIIIEGYFFANYIDTEKIKGKKIIIKRKSLINSMTQRLKRNRKIFYNQIIKDKTNNKKYYKYIKRELKDLVFTSLKSIIWYKEYNNFITNISDKEQLNNKQSESLSKEIFKTI